jgi:hypothetical protein
MSLTLWKPGPPTQSFENRKEIKSPSWSMVIMASGAIVSYNLQYLNMYIFLIVDTALYRSL